MAGLNLANMPDNLPAPSDDGAATHLPGMAFPAIGLPATDGTTIVLSSARKLTVLYVYPMTGHPDSPLPEGWDDIPGARGCTPQACSFRDHFSELQDFNVDVFGLSAQSTSYQREAKARLHLPFELLSDTHLTLKAALSLPTFTIDCVEIYKRITLILEQGCIKRVFYPVFPPNKNAEEVIRWLRQR